MPYSRSLLVIFFFFFGHTVQHVGSLYPDQELNLCSLQWKCGVLTIGPARKTLFIKTFFLFTYLTALGLSCGMWNLFFSSFNFILEHSKLTVLQQFQVDSRGTQPYIHIYPFSCGIFDLCCSMQDLLVWHVVSSLTMDPTRAPCMESVKSQSLNCQGRPHPFKTQQCVHISPKFPNDTSPPPFPTGNHKFMFICIIFVLF